MVLDLSYCPFIEMGVPWVTPAFSKGAVDRAGDVLRDADLDTAMGWITLRNEAEEVIDNWRSCHRYPLQVVRSALKKHALMVDSTTFVGSRTKRIPAIKAKLARRPNGANPRLSQMQDIGGCRAVLRSVRKVSDLVARFQAMANSPDFAARLDKRFDYISNPKRDGYRSHHLVFRYESLSEKHKIFNGQRIEVQIRSALQHQWATAVETVDFFTGQQLKSNLGDWDWKRFFALASAAVAMIERCSPVPNTPEDPDDLREALRVFDEQLDLLRDYSEVTAHIERSDRGNMYLLEVNPEAREVSITPFRRYETYQADEAFIRAEEQNRNRPRGKVALVTVDSFASLRKAYPNYFLDTSDFVATIDRFLSMGDV